MLRLRMLASKIYEIYQESHDSFSAFQQKSGLTCIPQCGGCCLNKAVSASTLEMIPTALDLFDRGLAETTLQGIENLKETSPCIFYIRTSPDGQNGFCSNYQFRPSICRCFGACAVTDKNGNKSLSVCKIIKNKLKIDLSKIDIDNAPIMGDFYRRILMLDFSNETSINQINESLRQAILKVLTVASYSKLDESRCLLK